METSTGEGTQLLGFTDDLALIVTAKDQGKLESMANRSLKIINRWMVEKGLEVAPHKTKAIVLSTKKTLPTPNIVLCRHRIPIAKDARYLRVKFDSRMTFRSHIRNIANSTRGIIDFLAKIMPNSGGPNANKRRLIMNIANSRLLYAAPLWANTVMKYTTSRGTILGAQRAAALCIIRAYRTVSSEAALAIAGTPPANLLAVEEERIRSRIKIDPQLPRYKVRTEERARTITIWSSLWRANRSSALVTKKYIPDLRRWLDRPNNVEPTFHLTQFLTGHGRFGIYLHRMGKISTPTCPYCGNPEDSPLHTFFECHIWDETRAPLIEALGQPLVLEMVQTILCGPPNNPSSTHININ